MKPGKELVIHKKIKLQFTVILAEYEYDPSTGTELNKLHCNINNQNVVKEQENGDRREINCKEIDNNNNNNNINNNNRKYTTEN